MKRLEGKVAIVTGAALGQGEATARLFAEHGAFVIVADILDQGQQVADEIGSSARYIRLDVSDEDSWISLVSTVVADHGKIDVLINNAAIVTYAPIVEMTKSRFERVLSTNLTGTFLGLKTVMAHMMERGSGSIVNIASINATRGTAGMAAYDASKWGVRGITRTAAMEAGPHGVRVNSIYPGAIDTRMLHAHGMKSEIALGRVGQPAEVAQASLFLAGDESSYVAGAELVVDGGWTAGRLFVPADGA